MKKKTKFSECYYCRQQKKYEWVGQIGLPSVSMLITWYASRYNVSHVHTVEYKFNTTIPYALHMSDPRGANMIANPTMHLYTATTYGY